MGAVGTHSFLPGIWSWAVPPTLTLGWIWGLALANGNMETQVSTQRTRVHLS
jgi:hypothetical protein